MAGAEELIPSANEALLPVVPASMSRQSRDRFRADYCERMSYIFDALLVLHFLGLASLIGGFLVQIKSSPRVINKAMLHGVITQLVTGVLMVGMLYPLSSSDPGDFSKPDNAKITVKLGIAVIILVIVLLNRKKSSITSAVWGLIGGLAILNVIIAVFWS